VSEKSIKTEREAERFTTRPKTGNATYVKGYWKPIEFHKLRKGDIFRLWDKTGSGRVPDHFVDGKHDVSVAVSDVYEHENTHGIECIPIRGF
jgi:hypothetical protein